MRKFNVCAACMPEKHYMVDLTSRCRQIREMIDNGDYFCINRGRQYGKTTLIKALERMLADAYTVFSLSFETLGDEQFLDEKTMSRSFLELLQRHIHLDANVNPECVNYLEDYLKRRTSFSLPELQDVISGLCRLNSKPIVIIIDEVDQASNYESFLKLLGLLRGMYIDRDRIPTFQSVILASVYNIKNLKLKIRPETGKATYNSPWNIAANFRVDMSFNSEDIAGMLQEYEKDHGTGMDIKAISDMIYDYTSGYPFLVSRLCQILDDELPKDSFPSPEKCWTKVGFLAAEKILLVEQNTLFDDLVKKLSEQPELKQLIHGILLNGEQIPYQPANLGQSIALMFNFIKNSDGLVTVSNRIFETYLYNLFLYEERLQVPGITAAGTDERTAFIKGGRLDMALVLERFQTHYSDLFGDSQPHWLEKDARKCFLLFLKPIINGTGHYYIEAQTRDSRQMDVVVNYNNEEFVIELKIWRGAAYNSSGETQLCAYLEKMHLSEGYLLTFDFRKGKKTGQETKTYGSMTLHEYVV